MKQKRVLDQVGLRLSRQALRVLKERGIFAHSPVSLEHQHFAKRYVVRGLESGGAVGDLGPEPSSWRNQRSSPRRIGTSEPAARSVAASRPDARSNGSARYSKQYQKYHLSARLHGDGQTAIRVHQCDETPAHAGLRGQGQRSRLRT